MDYLMHSEIWVSLLTLTLLEIVLGIDNLVFIAVLAGRLPLHQQGRARKAGLALALITRLGLLGSIAWIVSLTQPLFEIAGHSFSWRDLVLIGGGLFLLYKATIEIHRGVESDQESERANITKSRFSSIVFQIVLLDIVFSIDSVITAVGMTDMFLVMASAVIIAVGVMLFASAPLAAFIHAHPTVKMLALSFLLLIGVALIADGTGFHVPKGYIYVAIGFSILVEALNQLARRRKT